MKKLFKWFGLGLLVFLVLSVVGLNIYKTSQTDALYEAVVRDFATDGVMPPDPPKYTIFFVGINGKDPSTQFLQKFQGSPFSIRPISQGKPNTSGSGRDVVMDINTGEEGKVINLGRIAWFFLLTHWFIQVLMCME